MGGGVQGRWRRARPVLYAVFQVCVCVFVVSAYLIGVMLVVLLVSSVLWW